MKKVKLIPEEVREFHEHDRWVKDTMNGCENMRDSKLVSIPVSSSRCSVIDDVCRFDICPKRKETSQEKGC